MNSIIRAPRILVFDSGVGGLSILRELQRKLPLCEWTYASDNEAFPYGIKSETELTERVDQVLHGLLQIRAADIIVVACNTASTLTLPHIRRRFSQPIVGVVPAIKPAAARSRSKVIGLLATPATVTRPYTQELIQQFAADCTVIRLGSSELVEIAEQKLGGEAPSLARLQEILAPMQQHPQASQMDTLVLACTHFPLLRDELRQVLPEHLEFIDSTEAIARRVEFLLVEQFGFTSDALRVPALEPQQNLALFTRDTPAVQRLRQPLSHFNLKQLTFVTV